MAKYFMTFVLLLCLALENDNIYNRLHARSHPSVREDSDGVGVHFMRQHQQYQQLQLRQASKQQTPPQQQHHTKQQRTRQPKHVEPDPSEEEDLAAIRGRYYARLRRHLGHQLLHQLEQEQSYNHAVTSSDELSSIPRLWQHLSANWRNMDLSDYDSFDSDKLVDDILAEQKQEQEQDESMFDSIINEYNIDPLAVAKSELQQELRDQLLPLSEEVEDKDKGEGELQDNSVTEPRNASKPAGGCPKAENIQHLDSSEEELTRLRIDFVKKQILEKLRLKESPKVSAVELPQPIFEGVTLAQADDMSKSKDLDDYYARTSKKFIFLKREHRHCQSSSSPSLCFSFKIDEADADGFDVSTAVLWLFRKKQNHSMESNETLALMPSQQTIVISEMEQQLHSKHLTLSKTIATQTVDEQDKWMKIDIESPIKRWFAQRDLNHIIRITCESCNIDSMEEIISINKDFRPFIMIDTQNRRIVTRQKRSINCSDGVTECCREKLYISFKDIGWADWIIQPAGYDAYFCRGSCNSVASVAQSSSHHSSIMKILLTNPTRKPLELVPCCTARQYSPLTLVVLDSNNSVAQKTLPNMIVESCGCR